MPVKLGEGWEKLHIKGALRLSLDERRVFFWRLYLITVTASLKAEPAFPCVATENTKLAITMMKESGMIHHGRGDTGPAGRTSLLHAAASHVPQVLVHNPTPTLGWMRGEGIHDEAEVVLLTGALCLFQICISNSIPLCLPNFSLSSYFPSLKTSLSFLISMKHSLGRVEFILFNVFLLDKHLGIAICLAEILFPPDTGQ